MIARLASLAIVLLVASVVEAMAASRCPSTRTRDKARIRTVAWVNTTCRTDTSGLVLGQQLVVRRGDRAPVIVSHSSVGPVPNPAEIPLDLCRVFALFTTGEASAVAGSYTALGVSPDGTHVVFELNERFSILHPRPLPDDERGVFIARADGGDRVRLAPPTDAPQFRRRDILSFDFGGGRTVFSPDGRYVVYSDLGPASDGTIDAQLFALRLADREKIQLTHLARLPGGMQPLLYVFAFTDDDTVGFYTFDYGTDATLLPRQEFYSVSVTGKDFRKLSPVLSPSGQVIAQFALTGRRPAVQGLFVDGEPENPMGGVDRPRELFVAFRKKVLQLTHFNRVDVGNLPVLVDRKRGHRVFFSASADPLGCNPTNNCQLFSIDTFGGHLRQLTRFAVGDRSDDGCFNGPAPGCVVALVAQDPATGTLIFSSQCDPFGTNPNGSQLFAARPDGSGLRQITQARGIVTDTPDVFEVELPGPFAYQ